MPVEIKVVIPDAASPEEDDNDINEAHSETNERVKSAGHVRRNHNVPKRRPASAPPQQTMSIRLPVASSYDVDNEYDYIMDKALNAYKKHCDKEKADARQRQLRSSYRKRILLSQSPRTPKHVPGGRPRPWSALPSKFDAIKEVGHANNQPRDRNIKMRKSYSSLSLSSDGMTEYRSRYNSTPRKVLNVRTITLGSGAMDNAVTRKSSSYQRRNQTSYSWYSQSFPNASFLQQPGQSYTVRRSQSQTTSPVKTDDTKKRPSTGYEYDGGLFNPCTPRRDYFVIHPDWVSESVTIQKLSLNERNRKAKSQTWPGRRCRSAPPPKLRNPITWE